MANPEMPCLLCGKMLGQRTDRNGKPYFVCDPCGIQLFIRRQAGIERLARLTEELRSRKAFFQAGTAELHQVQALLAEIDGLRAEIKKIADRMGWFGDSELENAQAALKRRLKAKLAALDALGQSSRK